MPMIHDAQDAGFGCPTPKGQSQLMLMMLALGEGQSQLMLMMLALVARLLKDSRS